MTSVTTEPETVRSAHANRSCTPEDGQVSSSALLRRGKGDRGATLVEYALMLCLVAVLCTTAIRGLGNKSSDSFADAHAGISAAATTAGGSGDGGDGAGGGDGGDGGATTALAPSTTLAATATTVPATTTTLTQTWIELSNPTTAQPTSSAWTATSRLSVLSTSAVGVPGAVVTMKVRSLKNGVWSEATVNVTTAANGTVTLHDATTAVQPLRTRSHRCSWS